jgi:Predicted membrane protein (DUF2053).
MKKQHFLSERRYFWGSFTAAMVYGVTQFPKLVDAATFQLLAKVNREDVTEAVFIGVGLLVCLIGLFGLDHIRARHPRTKKSASKLENKMTGSASTQY